MSVSILPPSPDEKAKWLPLWRGYLKFYKCDLPDAITDLTWERFFDDAEPVYILAAKQDETWLGFTAFVLHRSTWAETYYCYLEDLFVAEAARGKGVARQLIEAVADFARTQGCGRLYWQTQESNTTAQALYDRIAAKSDFIQYVKAI
ncbi:MAG: GNAT family N-acetyltransferase [Caulobacterales bacterium]